MIPLRHSFKLLSRAEVKKIRLALRAGKNPAVLEFKKDSQKSEKLEAGGRKRAFLKLAGLVGLGVAASTLIPKKAEALVFGSTPASNVVGLKDSSNVRISPAKEDGNLATIAGKDFATQATLALIKTQTDKLTFDGTSNLKTVGGAGVDPVGLKDTTSTQINPATDDSLTYLRRIVRQIDSLAVVDSAQRQKVTVEGATITSGTITTVTTVTTAASVTNLVALGGVDGRYLFIDTARNAYANGIRSNLINA